ncbi:MAG: hypothetical protein LAT68_06100 [Cyclobacteriaceae bacterium]|nr:hypothetical protein [Cyclobacteriaceae bacterium]MCH8515883.1 hypothetical protein [Cyclobacteriaceae bacterium]
MLNFTSLPKAAYRIILIAAFFLLTLIAATPTRCLAQESSEQDYLILTSGERIVGEISHINERGVSPKYYRKIRLTDDQGKRRKFRRKHVVAFQAAGSTYESFHLTRKSSRLLDEQYAIDKRGTQHFLKVRTKGSLSHYQMEWWEQGSSTTMTMDLLKKEGDDFLIRATQGLLGVKRRTLTSYFSDCPQLAAQIENRNLKELSEIVAAYNDSCGF